MIKKTNISQILGEKLKAKAKQKLLRIYDLHIKNTSSNTFLTITDAIGQTLIWTSCGQYGFKGSLKSTYMMRVSTGANFAEKALALGFTTLKIIVTGYRHRSALIKPFLNEKFKIYNITYQPSINHNGCRPKKKRRK